MKNYIMNGYAQKSSSERGIDEDLRCKCDLKKVFSVLSLFQILGVVEKTHLPSLGFVLGTKLVMR